MPSKGNRCVTALRQHVLLFLILAGVVLGIAAGFAIRPLHPSENAKMWLGLPGRLYLRSLKMMIVPLVISSVITGTASLDPRSNGKISLVAFTYVFATNTIGAVMGVVTFLVFKPGQGGMYSEAIATKPATPLQTQDIFADLLRNIIPDNLFRATFEQTQTKYSSQVPESSNSSGNATAHFVRTLGNGGGPNLLGLIFASTFIGIAISTLKKDGRPLYKFFDAATKAVILIIRWFMWFTPIGVFSLTMVPVAGIKDVGLLFGQLGVFSLSVIVAIILHQSVVLPLILFVTTRRNPFVHMSKLPRPWIIAFAASSTAVALPDMLYVCEVKLGVDKRVSRFTLPFCVSLSANGSAVFIVCSCLFISNLTGVQPTASTIFIVGVLTSVSTLAIPSVPSASIVTIIMILTSLDISTEPIALLLTVEFILDRLRTTSSLVSHTVCAVVTHHICRNMLSHTDNAASGGKCEDSDEDEAVCDERDSELVPMNGGPVRKHVVDYV